MAAKGDALRQVFVLVGHLPALTIVVQAQDLKHHVRRALVVIYICMDRGLNAVLCSKPFALADSLDGDAHGASVRVAGHKVARGCHSATVHALQATHLCLDAHHLFPAAVWRHVQHIVQLLAGEHGGGPPQHQACPHVCLADVQVGVHLQVACERLLLEQVHLDGRHTLHLHHLWQHDRGPGRADLCSIGGVVQQLVQRGALVLRILGSSNRSGKVCVRGLDGHAVGTTWASILLVHESQQQQLDATCSSLSHAPLDVTPKVLVSNLLSPG
mmetsp:Transcript_30673/g.79882  ORF Transcript_30673/g.79882 Transcript_30673/m.79882 type:complete len:271 (-) Transcript_30673:3097-3909(-)